ncbi:hypothetical protein ASZ78_015292 [Callipepla squamata]|uniref:Ninein-like protein n=1 Tax=Callipepla squamata TaxID=9009 RepID=A0A226NLM1_CALSU|nr:hypothetical protein ASZ78_015292 [Callipepla squamata]
MVSRNGLQDATITSYAYKLQCLKSQVRQISKERDKARLGLEKAERHCLQLSRELDKQYIALEHSQSKLKDVQTEMETKELLLQQAANHQAKLEADAQFLQGKQATLHGRLNFMMKENIQLQNKVVEMGEKLTASENLVLELQKEINLIVKDKLDQEEPHNPELLKHGKHFAEIVLEYERQCQVSYYEEEMELMRKNFEREKNSKECVEAEMSKVESKKKDLKETIAKAVTDVTKEQKCMQSLEVEPARVELQHTKNLCHPRQQLNQEGEELRAQCRNRGSIRGEQGWLLEENSLLKSQLGRLQQELREVKKYSRHDEKHKDKLSNEKVEELAEVAKVKELSRKGEVEVSHVNIKEGQLAHELLEHEDSHITSARSMQLQNQRLKEAEQLQGVEMATRLEYCQQHAACWSEMELLRQQLEASQEELLEAKVSLSVAQTQHALQLQQAKEQLNNVVPRKQFEQLQISLREEQSRVQQLQANLQQQAEQACRQLVRTQEERERLLQAAMEQAEGLQCDLRNAEAALADRTALLKDAQAQLSRNKLLIKDLHEENRGFAMALQAAEVKQKSIEKKNHMLEEQALALKKLIGKITPASLSA